VVATTVLLSFISFWRAAAIVLNDLGSTAFYVGGIVEQALGKAAPWFILGVMCFSYAVRAVYIESSAMFVRGGVYRVVKEAMGGTLAKLSVSALLFDYVLTGPISGVSAGQYIVGLLNDLMHRAGSSHMLPVGANVPVVGSYSSALAVAPPTTSTFLPVSGFGSGRRGSPVAIALLAPFQLGRFLCGDQFNDLVYIRYCAHDIFIQDAHTAGSDRTNGELLKTGNAEFAHNKNIERRAKTLRHFERDRDAAPRETKHGHVGATSILEELFRK